MTTARRRLTYAIVVAVVTTPLVFVGATASLAGHATKADVASAKARLDALNHQLEVIVERYNSDRVLLQQAQQQLSAARSQMQEAQAVAASARSRLSESASQAYMGMGSEFDLVLGAQDFAQLSDRLEYIGTVAQVDADLAVAADDANQRAEWAAQRYSDAVDGARTQLEAVNAQRDQISGLLAQAQTLYQQTNAHYQAFLAAQRAALAAQRARDNAAPTSTAPSGNGTGGAGSSAGGGSGGGPAPPPTNLSGAAAAIAAAKSVLGVRYVFASADPSVGFDCSGLTMWSWAHAGVSLPHSSAMQYAVLPHVDVSQIQPGDLLFFYSPISHVALYLGGGMIIHATHPGPGGEVHIESLDPIWRPLLVGAARP